LSPLHSLRPWLRLARGPVRDHRQILYTPSAWARIDIPLRARENWFRLNYLPAGAGGEPKP
jgi:hypothetical protein